MEYEFLPLKLKEYYENDKWLKKDMVKILQKE